MLQLVDVTSKGSFRFDLFNYTISDIAKFRPSDEVTVCSMLSEKEENKRSTHKLSRIRASDCRIPRAFAKFYDTNEEMNHHTSALVWLQQSYKPVSNYVLFIQLS